MDIEALHALFLASDGVSTDTRNLKKNTLFFALKGDNFNGNEFALKALESGCVYAVVEASGIELNAQMIVVEDVLETIQALASYHRSTFDIPVIGITGSNGKTTSKELLGAVLSRKYETLMTTGNLNNHIGVPLTLLQLTSHHEMAIIEMGANKQGDIQELVEIAKPTHGIITNIGAAHLEGFGSIEGVLKEKTALYRYLGANNGHIFYNSTDQNLVNALLLICTKTGFGEKAADDEVKGMLVNQNPFVNFTYSVGAYSSDLICTNLVGRYNFDNFIATLAIGHFFNVDFKEMDAAIASYQPSNNRSQITRTNKNVLVVDCYNANPTSVSSALESFSEIEHGNKLVILGDMLELGGHAEKEHQKIITLLTALNLDAILIGTQFGKLNAPFQCFKDVNELITQKEMTELTDKLILLKGSRGIKLETLVSVL